MNRSIRHIGVAFSLLLTASSNCLAGMDKDELALAKSIMDDSGITAAKSISLVNQEFAGIVYDYELDVDDDNDDALIHQIKLIDIDEDVKRKITLSALDGSVVKIEESSLFSWFYEDDSLVAVKKLQQLKYTLLDSMTLIALPVDGFFHDIELEDKHGIVYFELETFSADGEQEILVNAKTRSIIPVFQR